MKLITDTTNSNEIKLLKEDKNSSVDGIYITGIYAQSDIRNGNGRIYPREELSKEMNRLNEEMCKTNRLLSELEHPDKTVIDPQRACSRILELKEDNGSWIGKSIVMASIPEKGIKGTPCGDLLASLLNFGTQLGHSTRAVGEVDDKGIVHDLKLITIDVVTNPSIGIMNSSNANRFVNGILESKDFMLDQHGQIVESGYKKLAKKLGKMPNTAISSKKNEYLVNAVNDFLKNIF